MTQAQASNATKASWLSRLTHQDLRVSAAILNMNERYDLWGNQEDPSARQSSLHPRTWYQLMKQLGIPTLSEREGFGRE
jgi:hypothetical protein